MKFRFGWIVAVLLGVGCLGLRAAPASLAVLDNLSRLEVEVKATVDSFTAQLVEFHPTLEVDGHGNIVAARLSFHFADLKTGKEKRDRAMGEWLQTEKYPDGSFELLGLTGGLNGKFEARARMTLHGQTREFSFPVTIISDQKDYAVDGEAVLDTREFGLPVIRMFALLKVDPMVHVRFHLQAKKAA